MPSEIATSVVVRNAGTLTAYYRFETGALTTDSSGNSNTLTAISDPAETTGVFGGGVDFDGNDAYSRADDADFEPTSDLTVGCWMKTSTTGVNQMLLQDWSYNGSEYSGYQFLITSSNVIRFQTAKNSGNVAGTDYQLVSGSTNICDGAWHWVVGLWDDAANRLRVYVDGNSDATEVTWANAPVYAATTYIRVGCRCNAGSNDLFYTGSMDDLFLLKGTALTAQQISDLYAGANREFFKMF